MNKKTKKSFLITVASIFTFVLATIIFVSCNKNKSESSTDDTPISIAIGIGKIVPKGGVSKLASPVSGIVSQINVSIGDSITKDTPLIVLDSSDASLSYDEIDNRYKAQMQGVESAKIELEKGQVKLRDIERRFTDLRELLAVGAVSAESVRLIENEFNMEKQQLDVLRKDVNIQQSSLDEIKSQKEMKKLNLENTSLKSPIDGIVLDIIPHLGEALSIYDSYIVVAPHSPLIVSAEIDEMFSDKIKIGQICKIYVSGQSNHIGEGKIITISPDLKQKSLFSDSGQDFQDRRVRIIEVSIDNKVDILIDTKVECVVQLN